MEIIKQQTNSSAGKSERKQHAVLIPLPSQGHINPMMKLGLLLHHKGFHITVVHTEANYKRLIESGGPEAVEGLPDFKFTTIPYSLEDFSSTTSVSCLGPLVNELITKLNKDAFPASCIIADFGMLGAIEAAEGHGIPFIVFQITSAISEWCVQQVDQLMDKGLLPLKDEASLDTVIDWIPGIIPLRLRDFPSTLLVAPRHFLKLMSVGNALSLKASATIVNTFDELEAGALTAYRSAFPDNHPVYAVGPVHKLLNKLSPDSANSFKWMSSSLWKQDHGCFEWLDSKPRNSVIYVSFGSAAELTPGQVSELVWGLANSNKSFLLVIREDLVKVKGEHDAFALPPEFWEEVGGRGYVVGWAPQEEVLAHPSVGGFLTHCGWNSTIESMSNGVPMLCLPYEVDQPLNCRYLCDEWGIGMEIGRDVKREEVEFLVGELLDGEKGKMMKQKAMEWKEKAERVVAVDGGSSLLNLEKLINEVLTF